MADEVRGEAEIQVVKMKDKLAKSSMLIDEIEDSYLPEKKLQARFFSKEIKLAVVEIHQFIDSKGDVKITEVEDFEILETNQLRMDLANRKQVHYRCSSFHSTLEQLMKEQHAFTFLNAYENLKGDFKEVQDMELGSIEVIRPPHLDKKLFTEELIQTLVQFKTSIETDLSKERKSESDSGPECTGGPLIQAQTAKKNVLVIAGHSWQSHPNMHRFDDIRFRSDGLTLFDEIEDDSKHVILALLWTHQDYFDQKLLSRAQAEYNFYRLLEKQWRQTLRRINMDDITYPKFFMNDFRSIPRNRALYAVICTILDLSKDENGHEAATKAAKEYQKLTVLELNMIQQKLITTIPSGLDIEKVRFDEILSDMRSTFRKSDSKALRPLDTFNMLPLFDYLKLKETITKQRNQIEDLADRLSGIASQQLADGDPGFTDLGDKNRPQKLGERFAELFDETWSSAYESLKPKGIDDDESDEGTMDTLQHIVQVIYDFCQKVSQEQIDRLIEEMIPPVINPVDSGTEVVRPASEQIRTKTEQMAREYRKIVAPTSVKVLQKFCNI